MDINFQRGIFRLKLLISAILCIVIPLSAYNYFWDKGWRVVFISAFFGTTIWVTGLWVGCWLIEKIGRLLGIIGRWIIRGFAQTGPKNR